MNRSRVETGLYDTRTVRRFEEETNRFFGSENFTVTKVLPLGNEEGRDNRILPCAEGLSETDFDPPLHVTLTTPSGAASNPDLTVTATREGLVPDLAVVRVVAFTVTGPARERDGPQSASPT
jgi:hypothetical protein